MEMIERYLNAIEFWLPAKQKQDIIAEISEDLDSRMEEMQGQLGRNLTEAETEGVLRQRGNPIVVANRYLPQRSLIGPALFPMYLFVLKVLAGFGLVPWMAVFLVVHRVLYPASGWGATIAATLGSAWTAAFIGAGAITAVFAVLERVQARTHLFDNWNPRKLPAVRDPNKIPRAGSTAELVFGVLFLVWWIGNLSSTTILDGPAFRLSLSPVWMYFFRAFVVVALFNIALAAANLLRPYWTVTRALFRAANTCLGGILFCWLWKADVVVSFTLANVDAVRMAQIRDVIRMWMDRWFPLAVLATGIIVAAELWRVVRLSRSPRRMERRAAAAQ